MVHRAGSGEWPSGWHASAMAVRWQVQILHSHPLSSRPRRKDADNRGPSLPRPTDAWMGSGSKLLSLTSERWIHYKHDFKFFFFSPSSAQSRKPMPPIMTSNLTTSHPWKNKTTSRPKNDILTSAKNHCRPVSLKWKKATDSFRSVVRECL